jgi:hypothetical protein
MHSTWGQGRTGPSKWIDAGVVHESLKGIKMVSLQLIRVIRVILRYHVDTIANILSARSRCQAW